MEERVGMNRVITKRTVRKKARAKNLNKGILKFTENLAGIMIAGLCNNSIKSSSVYFFNNPSVPNFIITALPTVVTVVALIRMAKIVKTYS